MPTVVVPLLDASGAFSSPSAGVPTVAAGDEAAPVYDIKVVSKLGSVATDLTLAEPDTVTWTLNQPDEATFHFPKGAYALDDAPLLASSTPQALEVQLYRNADLLTWGPIIGVSGAGSRGDIQCHVAGVDWYLNRLFLDGTITNLIVNADFEHVTTLDGWTEVGAATFDESSETFVTGTKAATITNTVANADTFLVQTVSVSAGRLGLALIASAWVYKDTEVEPAYGTRGLFLQGYQGSVSRTTNYAPIDNASPTDSNGRGAVGNWVKVQTYIWIPPFQTYAVDLRLYAPKGTVRWDDVKLVTMESVDCAGHDGFTLVERDIAYIIGILVGHVQNPAVGKANLYIDSHCPNTGTAFIKVYQYVDHVQFDQALRELIERDDGTDYYVALTPTTRTFWTFVNKRGVDRSSTLINYDVSDPTGSICTDYRVVQDAGSVITRQTILGDDNGPAREQGEAYDATNMGGTILQDVRQAPQGAHTSSLQPLAAERITRFAKVPFSIEMDVTGDQGLIPLLKCGDMVSVFINDGYFQVDRTMRIQRISLNCVTNIQTVTLAIDSL